MIIVDAQVHIWGPNTPERPWRSGQKPHRGALFGADELLREMDAAGVRRAVLVPPYWEAERHDVVLEAARLQPDRFAAMGRLDTEEPSGRGVFVNWCRQSGMQGLCCSFIRPQQISVLEEGCVDWLWEEAEAAGLTVMGLVPHSLVSRSDRVA